MIFQDNNELKKAVKGGVLDCKGEDLECCFDINIEASIINCYNIDCYDIKCVNIKCVNIDCFNIECSDIDCNNIKCYDIECYDIDCNNIKCNNINYYAFCIAYNNITCNSIKGRRTNSFHKALDGKIIIRNTRGCEKAKSISPERTINK